MHDKYKADLKKMGTSHGSHDMAGHHGQHHTDLHAIESHHSMGKKHHREEEI